MSLIENITNRRATRVFWRHITEGSAGDRCKLDYIPTNFNVNSVSRRLIPEWQLDEKDITFPEDVYAKNTHYSDEELESLLLGGYMTGILLYGRSKSGLGYVCAKTKENQKFYTASRTYEDLRKQGEEDLGAPEAYFGIGHWSFAYIIKSNGTTIAVGSIEDKRDFRKYMKRQDIFAVYHGVGTAGHGSNITTFSHDGHSYVSRIPKINGKLRVVEDTEKGGFVGEIPKKFYLS